MTAVTLAEFTLPPGAEAREPPEARGIARDGVRMLVSRRRTGEISHHAFGDLPGLLLPGDLVVVNLSAAVPAAVRTGAGLAVHFSTPLPDGSWLAELRLPDGTATRPYTGGSPGDVLTLPAGARLTLLARATGRLWRARLSTAVMPYLLRYGTHIRYSYTDRDWPTQAYRTVFATRPGSAEMPNASRPFTHRTVTALVTRGVTIAPITLHTGVSSLEGDEEPYPEPFDVPPATARLVNATRQEGGRVIAVGTTVVRALESAAALGGGPNGQATATVQATSSGGGSASGLGTSFGPGNSSGRVTAASGWAHHVVTPQTGLAVVDGLLTGLHEPRSSHLRMLTAFAGEELLAACYAEAASGGYLWHEFGDVHLLLP